MTITAHNPRPDKGGVLSEGSTIPPLKKPNVMENKISTNKRTHMLHPF